MKENSIEEDMKKLKESIIEEKYHIYNKDLKIIIERFLSNYKRVLKENEELKNQEATQRKINELLVQRYSNSISVQKVKDKIKKEIKYHEKNILDIENITMLKGKTAKEEAEIEFNKYAIVVLKKMLQELLEGKK